MCDNVRKGGEIAHTFFLSLLSCFFSHLPGMPLTACGGD